jgi:hypothetical protein
MLVPMVIGELYNRLRCPQSRFIVLYPDIVGPMNHTLLRLNDGQVHHLVKGGTQFVATY